MANGRGVKKKGIEFWRRAVERLQGGERASDLAAELGIDQRGLYRWRARLGGRVADPAREREAALREEVGRLKRVLADKVLEVDFLRGALHKVAERRRGKADSGEKASTGRSEK